MQTSMNAEVVKIARSRLSFSYFLILFYFIFDLFFVFSIYRTWG